MKQTIALLVALSLVVVASVQALMQGKALDACMGGAQPTIGSIRVVAALDFANDVAYRDDAGTIAKFLHFLSMGLPSDAVLRVTLKLADDWTTLKSTVGDLAPSVGLSTPVEPSATSWNTFRRQIGLTVTPNVNSASPVTENVYDEATPAGSTFDDDLVVVIYDCNKARDGALALVNESSSLVTLSVGGGNHKRHERSDVDLASRFLDDIGGLADTVKLHFCQTAEIAQHSALLLDEEQSTEMLAQA